MNDSKATKFASQLASLYQRVNYERQSTAGPRSFKLQTLQSLMQRLGDPHLAAPVIHIAGTKGKGSVSKMISEILREAGFKVGTYSSPHLERINQRISVNGEPISDDQFSATLEQLQPVVDTLDAELADRCERGLTFFEITTSCGFQLFANESVDVVVLEVGLGGRLDSTNVCQPNVCVITNIGLDHVKQLGDTIGAIAGEKAGIVKPGVPVVTGALHPEAIHVIHRIAAQRNAPLLQLGRDMSVTAHQDGSFRYQQIGTAAPEENPTPIEDLACAMPGEHQIANAALAISACLQFDGKQNRISHDHIRRGLALATLPGRTEVLCKSPLLMLDMAHNADSVKVLTETFLAKSASATRTRIILATTRDKNTLEIVEPLVALADELILTRYQSNPRGESIDHLQSVVDTSINGRREQGHTVPQIVIRDNPLAAWQYLATSIEQGDAICITGSAFLVAELRPMLQQWSADSASCQCAKP